MDLAFPKESGSTKHVSLPPFSRATYEWIVEWQKNLVFIPTLILNQVLTALEYLQDPELLELFQYQVYLPSK